MFELAIALKYLLPRRRQLSVSVIASLSIVVIALVVWLLIVFLSVTRGIEQRWMQTLVALNAPLRLTPSDEYYDSYYYQVDRYSLASGYSDHTVGEKLLAVLADPYDPSLDPELPLTFPAADRDPGGKLRDPVKAAFAAANGLVGFGHVRAHEFETALANLRLRLLREVRDDPRASSQFEQSFSSQASYLGALDGASKPLSRTFMPPTPEDLTHQLDLLALSGDNSRDEMPVRDAYLSRDLRKARLASFLKHLDIHSLVTREGGWIVPPSLYPTDGSVRVIDDGDRWILVEGRPPEGSEVVTLSFDPPLNRPLMIPAGFEMEAALDGESIPKAEEADDLRFTVQFSVQGVHFEGRVPYTGLALARVDAIRHFDEAPAVAPSWLYHVAEEAVLPTDAERGQGILLAKIFHDQGILLGDSGYLAFYASTPNGLAEQRLPVFVAGFYDPGLLPTGSRYVLVNPEVTRAVRASVNQIEKEKSNGIYVWIDDLARAPEAKEQLAQKLREMGVSPYWHVETFQEYEFARPLVQQFQSDRNLLGVISVIVITVACSNIISMLIVLVNDKRREIGILRSMGATGASIALIFATCGVAMGVAGSCLGIVAALITLGNLEAFVGFLSRLQGHEAFQTAFYGSLPNEVDLRVLLFVLAATAMISLLAGFVPAVKAARVRPAATLRSE